MKYYVVSPEEFEQEAIKRLDGGMDTYMDTSREKALEETSETLEKTGAGNRTRTDDLLITNQLLYQLSYPGI